MINFSFASNWLREWRKFQGQSQSKVEQKRHPDYFRHLNVIWDIISLLHHSLLLRQKEAHSFNQSNAGPKRNLNLVARVFPRFEQFILLWILIGSLWCFPSFSLAIVITLVLILGHSNEKRPYENGNRYICWPTCMTNFFSFFVDIEQQFFALLSMVTIWPQDQETRAWKVGFESPVTYLFL